MLSGVYAFSHLLRLYIVGGAAGSSLGSRILCKLVGQPALHKSLSSTSEGNSSYRGSLGEGSDTDTVVLVTTLDFGHESSHIKSKALSKDSSWFSPLGPQGERIW